MYEIDYSDFQTLIAKQSDTTYRIERDDSSHPSCFEMLTKICNIQYYKSAAIKFQVDNVENPSIIQVSITESERTVIKTLSIKYSN